MILGGWVSMEFGSIDLVVPGVHLDVECASNPVSVKPACGKAETAARRRTGNVVRHLLHGFHVQDRHRHSVCSGVYSSTGSEGHSNGGPSLRHFHAVVKMTPFLPFPIPVSSAQPVPGSGDQLASCWRVHSSLTPVLKVSMTWYLQRLSKVSAPDSHTCSHSSVVRGPGFSRIIEGADELGKPRRTTQNRV